MARMHLPARARDVIADVLIVAVVVASAFAPLDRSAHPQTGVVALPFLITAAVALLLRRRFPVAVLVVCTAVAAISLLTGEVVPAMELPIAIALYRVARHCSRRTTVISAVALAVLLPIGRLAASTAPAASLAAVLAPEVLQPAVLVAFAAALGFAIRANRAVIDAANDRARRAEESREAEADRRVAEDRLAIARDLHDSVAHRIAVINLHAGVAARSLRTRPDDAEASLAVIGESARSVIGEIQDLLMLLRSGGDRTADEPGPDRIDGLLGVFARNGLPVAVDRRDPLDDLDRARGAVVYRVVQEGLTNAHKHGSARAARLRILREPDGVTVEVTNPVSSAAVRAAGGHGLLGMRERVEAVGGSVVSGVRDGRFVLTVLLPLGDGTVGSASAARGVHA